MKRSFVCLVCCGALLLLQKPVAVAATESTLTAEETILFTKRLTELISIFHSGELYRVLMAPKFYYPSPSDPFSTGKVQASCNVAGEIPEREIPEFLKLLSTPEKLTYYDAIAPIACVPLMKKAGTSPDSIMDIHFIGQKLVIRIKIPSAEPNLVQADFLYSEKTAKWIRSKLHRIDNAGDP